MAGIGLLKPAPKLGWLPSGSTLSSSYNMYKSLLYICCHNAMLLFCITSSTGLLGVIDIVSLKHKQAQ
jgi:hypothetical protein